MNCIEKMYKEIEEIIRKEKEELERFAVPVREIKHGFSQDESFLTQEDEFVPVDYISTIVLSVEWDKKPLTLDRAKLFCLFIFKKYLCFNTVSLSFADFLKKFESELEGSDNLVDTLTKFENEFIDLLGGETEEIKTYFTNPYNALFKGDDGYYAVIYKGKFSDIKRPFGFNPNQMKKIVKENLEIYLNDFRQKLKSDKEYNALSNLLKAEVNKSDLSPIELESACVDKLFTALEKVGVKRQAFDQYLEEKGITIVKQSGYYFRKKAYQDYAEYKKIEFRY
ncbi:MAG: hypothetical protein IKJ14_01600 [Clostridia bacterium]|nr:hypothetical protein [Clostridia bacterium]